MKISVIVPVYNCDKYINRLINSILKQSYKNYEVIVLNDGSTDRSKELLGNFNDEKIKVIDKENTGVSDTRNKGLKLATGELICFLDSDDYIEQDYFKTIIEYFEKYKDTQLLNFGFYSDVEDKNLNCVSSDIIVYKEEFYNKRSLIRNDFVNLWDNTMLYNIWNKVYLNKIIKQNNIKFPEVNWGEDVLFNRAYLNVIHKLYNSKKMFYHYIREREGAATKNYKKDLFNIRKKEFFDFNEYFEVWEIKKEDYYEFSCRRFIERVLGCIENVYCSNLSFKDRYKEIKLIILDDLTKETIKNVKPRSKKIKIMLIPIKLKCTILTMMMGKSFHVIKTKCPSVFNKLKNRR